MQKLEKQYTSTDSKLLANPKILQDISRWVRRPQSIELACTDKCSLNCDFCSVKNRTGDELLLPQVKRTLREFRELWAKTVVLTGWGDPSMYYAIDSTIEYALKLWYEIGMISNGVMLKKNIKQSNLALLTWLRISLNSLDYVDDIDVPTILWTLWFSYVINARTTKEKIKKLNDYAEKYWADYVRCVGNCLSIEEKTWYDEMVEEIKKFPKLFYQQKEHKVPNHCWIGRLKPFINSDGWVYQCSANPLLERKFHPHFKIGDIENIKEIYENVKEFDRKLCKDWFCFFSEQNDVIQDVIDWKDIPACTEDLAHPNFL